MKNKKENPSRLIRFKTGLIKHFIVSLGPNFVSFWFGLVCFLFCSNVLFIKSFLQSISRIVALKLNKNWSLYRQTTYTQTSSRSLLSHPITRDNKMTDESSVDRGMLTKRWTYPRELGESARLNPQRR